MSDTNMHWHYQLQRITMDRYGHQRGSKRWQELLETLVSIFILFSLLLVYRYLLMIKETTCMFKTSSFKFDTITNLNASSASQHPLPTSTDGDGHVSTCHIAIIYDRCSRYTRDPGWCFFLFLFLEHALTTSHREGHITKTARDMTPVSDFLFYVNYSNIVIIN